MTFDRIGIRVILPAGHLRKRACKSMERRMRRSLTAFQVLAVALLISVGWTGATWAQVKMPRVGVLTFYPRLTQGQWFEPFHRTLADHGWIEGKNVSFEFRSAQSDPSHLEEAATDLVRRHVDVIVAVGAPCVRAAHAATRSIPIVASDNTTDPVAEGYVQSYGRPGGNLTGVFLDAPEFAGNWFQLLNAMVPGLSRVVVLWDPSPGATHLRAVESVARSLQIQIQVVEARKPDDLDKAFTELRSRPQALINLPSPMIYVQSERLAKLALKHRLPATSMARQFAEAGGALSYGPEEASAFRRVASLVAKILSGANPAELPVERPTKVQLVVNLKTARALGLTVPESVLYRADEVIR
jgi:putative tryptophan/tyrosine transport system substrate-binding protein